MNPNFTFKVVLYPILENGAVLVINPDVRLSVSAKGKNTELAKDFVSYFLKEENIWRFADNQSSFIPLDSKNKPSLNEKRTDKMNMIYTTYNIHHNSIDVYIYAGYFLRIDCNKAEEGLKNYSLL